MAVKEEYYTDLFYPDIKSADAMKERRRALSQLPQDHLEDMNAMQTASVLCRENPTAVMKLFSELCTDTDILDFRLDALEDILSFPRIIPAVMKTVNAIRENSRTGIAKGGEPETFSALGAHIEALNGFTAALDELHGYYEREGKNVRSKAMKRLFSFFEDTYSSEDYADLKSDLSELAEALSKRVRCVTVAINFNEEMRPVSAGIVGWSETAATEKPSIFEKILYRNARYADVNVKTLHNRYIEGTEPNETEKVLFSELEKITSQYIGRLNRALGSYGSLDFKPLAGIEEQLGIYENAAKLIEAARARGLKMCRPEYLPMNERRAELTEVYDIGFFRAAAAADTEAKGDDLVITNDITMDDSERFFLLCGANNGGKTTFTRAVGMCQILAQAGFYVPAASCKISPVGYIYTHFPKEENVGINTSRFTSEIKALKTISDTADEYSLLLMNESIQSTTPRECVEIASEILRIFMMIGVRGIFATHLTELTGMTNEINSDPDSRSRVGCLAVCVDEKSGERTYRIRHGLPGESAYADTIFRRFGISAEEIRKRLRGAPAGESRC